MEPQPFLNARFRDATAMTTRQACDGVSPQSSPRKWASTGKRVNRVVTFTGQSLSGPPDVIPLLRLSDGAYDWESRKIRFPAKGHFQALALNLERGRVVVSGEAALFSAQVDPVGIKFGMNRANNDDRQFLLNILHWLSRAM